MKKRLLTAAVCLSLLFGSVAGNFNFRDCTKANASGYLYRYISDVIAVRGKTESEAKDKCPKGYRLIATDLNRGAGGDYIYFCYKESTDRSEAITDVVIDITYTSTSFANFISSYMDADYTRVNTDLNAGAGGDYIYLYYSKNAKKTPISDLVVHSKTTNYIPDSVVCTYNSDVPADLNKSVGGYWIYLSALRNPD